MLKENKTMSVSDFFGFALAYALIVLGTCGGLYILGQVLSIPYQNKTDRLWKTNGDDDETPENV
jgi:hypothetical protein